MDGLRQFLSEKDLDGALHSARGVDGTNADVQTEICRLLDSNWTVLSQSEKQGLYNLLQNSSLIPADRRRDALLKALDGTVSAFKLAGIVGAQGTAADVEVKARLIHVCKTEKNNTVCGRAGTALRPMLAWPEDSETVLAILSGVGKAAHDEALALIIENTWKTSTEEQVRALFKSGNIPEDGAEKFVSKWLSFKKKKETGGFAFLGGGLQYIPNLVELEMQDRFPDLDPQLLNNIGGLFDQLAAGADTITRDQFLVFSKAKGDNLTLDDITQHFRLVEGQEEIDIFHFIEGLIAVMSR